MVTVGVWTGRFSVSFHDALSRLICAGWLPQDGVFGWSVTAGLRTSVAWSLMGIGLLIASGRIAPRAVGPGGLTPTVSSGVVGPAGQSSGRTASDQHQPASSRATATFAITGRFVRSA